MLLNELAETISLEGAWHFSLGKENVWGEIQVPGCWEAQGYSKFIDGPARYRRQIFIPAAWAGQRIFLEFGAVSYACSVYLNGRVVGQHTGIWSPFSIDVTSSALPGEENLLELEIWKPGERYPMRASLAGFLPDVATTFGGIWQSAHLCAVTCTLTNVLIQTDYETRSIHVRAQADLTGLNTDNLLWNLDVYQNGVQVKAGEWPYDMRQPLDVVLYLKDVLLWSPESPNLYDVQLALMESGAELARITRRVGFRQLSAAGTQLLLNGKPFMVRGVLSWGWVPERVAPTYTREQALIELRQVRAMGFNLIKLCLVVPSPEYFEVADEEGLLLWEEFPLWLPEVTAEMRAQAPLEYAGMADRLAKHPSLVLYSLGCELNQAVDGALINQLNTAVRSRVNDVLICDNSGSGESYGGLDFDFSDFTDYHPYYDLHYFEPLLDHWRRDWQTPRPWIFGEFCDSDTFRNLNEIIQANNGTRPWWLTRENPVTTWRSESKAMLEWETRLSVSQPGVALEEIVQTSLNQSYTIRKYTLEALRRRRGMGGYIVTGLRDTPISTSGIWDDFGRPKWTPDAFLHVNGEAVLALDVVRRRQWCFGGDRPDRVDPHNFWSGEHASWFVVLNDSGAGFPAGSALSWSLDDVAGQVLASGTSELKQDIHPGTPAQAGSIQVSLPQVDHPAELRLGARLSSGKREALNSWPVWVYPQPRTLADGLAIDDPVSVLADFGDWLSQLPQIKKNPLSSGSPPALVATTLDNSVWEYLQAGGRVLLLQLGETPLPVRRCSFWREAVNLFADHPLWEQFPQRGFTDLQFFGLATDLAFDSPHLAEALPRGSVIRPILRRLDAREFHISEYLFEAAIGQGLLIGCTLRLQGGAGAQPFGWNRNVAGGALLHLLLQILTQPV